MRQQKNTSNAEGDKPLMGPRIELAQVIQALEAAMTRLPIIMTGRPERRSASQTRLSRGWQMNPSRNFRKTAPAGFFLSRPGMRSTTTASWRTLSAVFRSERPGQSLRRPFVERELSAGSKAGSVITAWNSVGMHAGQRHTIESRCVGVRNMASSQ